MIIHLLMNTTSSIQQHGPNTFVPHDPELTMKFNIFTPHFELIGKLTFVESNHKCWQGMC